MRIDRAPAFRHVVVESGAGGTGCELDDGRVLYVWGDGGAIKRGWIESVDVLASYDLPAMTGAATIATGLAGSCSVAMVGGRPLMAVVHKPGGGGSTGVTGTGSFPSLGVAFSVLESLDDGATWSLLGTGSVGNTASSIGLGAGVEAGPIMAVPGGLVCSANFFGNYFGDSTPNPGIYYSSDGGASWTAVYTPDGGAFSGNFSRNVAVDGDGKLWWYTKGGGFGSPYMHVHSSAGGGSWTDEGSTGGTFLNLEGSYGWDDANGPWEYVGNGLLAVATPDFAGDWTQVADKFVHDIGSPYPADIGTPAMVGVSRDRTLAFAGRWVDLVTVGRGWQINRLQLGG